MADPTLPNPSSPIKSCTKIGRLRTALMELWTEHKASGALPTSARFLFYELIARGVISKVKTGARRPDQDMGDALTDLREDGKIPWEDIVDETRSLEDYTGAGSVTLWVLSVLRQARVDPWSGKMPKGKILAGSSGKAPIIITESRSLAGVLRSVASEYAVRIASTNGQCGGFLHTVIGPALHHGHRVLYLGVDFSGGHIEANTRRILEQQFIEPEGALLWERLALTEVQAEEYGLTPIPKYDKRDRKWHDAIETEALSQEIIAHIVCGRLTQLLPEPLEAVLERERIQREKLRRILHRRNLR